MGVYVTTSAIFTLLPGLDATGTTALVDTHIVRAEGMVNGMLSKKYTVPFTSTAVPPIIRQLVEDYSCYFTMRSLYTRDSQNKSDWTAEFRDLASVTLMEIVNNKVALVDTAGSVLPGDGRHLAEVPGSRDAIDGGEPRDAEGAPRAVQGRRRGAVEEGRARAGCRDAEGQDQHPA